MNARAYYNEHEPFAAAWLRNLVAAGLIAPGDVDERDIRDVLPSDLAGYTQCHFFAGIGVWSYALRNAGWPDGRRVWTGSCPCQPFSQAGAGEGFDDERHLWPAFYWLISQCRPPVVFGEQVASHRVDPWIDLVQADVEALGYTFGCVPFPAAGVGAPHIRDRTYWVADGTSPGRRPERPYLDPSDGAEALRPGQTQSGRCSAAGRLDFAPGSGRPWSGDQPAHGIALQTDAPDVHASIGHNQRPGPTSGVWRDADWLRCRDGKWRPVEPGSQPLVDGAASRVGRLRAYGNAIVAPQAEAFIRAYLGN